jgi:tyrosine-protein kinase
VELREYLLLLRKRWITVTAFTVLGVLLAVLLTQLTPKSYQARTKSFVSVSSVTQSDATASIQQASQFSLARVKSYTELADSVTLLRPVIDDLGLNESVAQLASRVSVTNPLDTVILTVTVTDASPTRAATIANAVADQLSSVIEQLEPPVAGKPLVKVTVTKRAVPSATPVTPKPSLNLALGLLVGLIVGIGVAMLRQQFDRSVRTPRDIHTVVGVNPLGLIPKFGRSPSRPLVALTPKSASAQSFRGLRANLHLLTGPNPPKCFVITSAVGGEGRTVTASNLALTMALAGLRVCLVEADLRRPAIAKYLGLDSSLGIADVVKDLAVLDDALVRYHDTSLSVLTAGDHPVDPTEVLNSSRLAALFGQLSSRFDMVVIDTPPLLPVPDAQVVAAVTDGALVIARHGKTARTEFAEAIANLRVADVRILGAALVGVPGRESESFAYHYRESAWNARTANSGKAAVVDAPRPEPGPGSAEVAAGVSSAADKPDSGVLAEKATTATRAQRPTR